LRTWGLWTVWAPLRKRAGKGVHIYVLDTGVRTTHKEFRGARRLVEITDGVDRICSGPGTKFCARDFNGHGTHCAGTAAGKTYGVAPRATIHAVKVMGDDGKGLVSWIVRGVQFVYGLPQRPAVMSMSVGAKGTGRSAAMDFAINRAVALGVTVVVAAGNNGRDACDYTPAFINAAITVAASTSHDSMASFSNYGSCVDLFAPGVDIPSAGHHWNKASKTLSGTSMACPHVSGAVALWLTINPDLQPGQIKEKLLSTSVHNVIQGPTKDTPNVRLRAPCAESDSFKDAKNQTCRYWRRRNCKKNRKYTHEQLMEVRESCPIACKFC